MPLLFDVQLDAVTTVLEHESFLFTDSEKLYLQALDSMSRTCIQLRVFSVSHTHTVHALYLLIRLSLRKPGWLRLSDFDRYRGAFDEEQKLDEAYDALCPPKGKYRDVPIELPKGSSRNVPIDLTLESEDDEPQVSAEEPVEDQQEDQASVLVDNSSTLLHASSHDDAELSELLELLLKDELVRLAKSFKLNIQGQKVMSQLCDSIHSDSRSEEIWSSHF